MTRLQYDTDTGRVVRDDKPKRNKKVEFKFDERTRVTQQERDEYESRPTHTPDGVPIENPPDVILVSRAWYDSIRQEVTALRDTLHRLTRSESD